MKKKDENTQQNWPTDEEYSFREYENYNKTRKKKLFCSGYSASHWNRANLS